MGAGAAGREEGLESDGMGLVSEVEEVEGWVGSWEGGTKREARGETRQGKSRRGERTGQTDVDGNLEAGPTGVWRETGGRREVSREGGGAREW